VTLGMPAITEMALSGVTWPADKERNQTFARRACFRFISSIYQCVAA
jgi:hypothetical protein